MADDSTDSGLIVTLAKRLGTQRLPRALDLKDKVDQDCTRQARQTIIV